jgi:enolase
MSKIASLDALEILDSRGNPTVQVTMVLETGAHGTAKIPSGASTGKLEAVELRDGDNRRFGGLGVLKAVSNVVNEIQPAIRGFESSDQAGLDEKLIALDGTPNKARLGANAMLGVSIAAARATANEKHVPLYRYLADRGTYTIPVPMLNVLNGGKHADNNVDFQEFMIAPVGAPSFAEALRSAAETFQTLKKILKVKGYSTSVGDEGGFAPRLRSNEEPMELLRQAIQQAGYKPGADIAVNLDPAASEFYDDGAYVFTKSDRSRKTPEQMVALWTDWLDRYPEIYSLEDGLAEDDWDGWRMLTAKLGDKIQLVGDDIFVTNPEILAKGIKQGVANSVLSSSTRSAP